MALEEKSTIVKEEIAVIRAWVEVQMILQYPRQWEAYSESPIGPFTQDDHLMVYCRGTTKFV